MRRQGRKNRRIFGNGVTILGLVLVVALLAIGIRHGRGKRDFRLTDA